MAYLSSYSAYYWNGWKSCWNLCRNMAKMKPNLINFRPKIYSFGSDSHFFQPKIFTFLPLSESAFKPSQHMSVKTKTRTFAYLFGCIVLQCCQFKNKFFALLRSKNSCLCVRQKPTVIDFCAAVDQTWLLSLGCIFCYILSHSRGLSHALIAVEVNFLLRSTSNQSIKSQAKHCNKNLPEVWNHAIWKLRAQGSFTENNCFSSFKMVKKFKSAKNKIVKNTWNGNSEWLKMDEWIWIKNYSNCFKK